VEVFGNGGAGSWGVARYVGSGSRGRLEATCGMLHRTFARLLIVGLGSAALLASPGATVSRHPSSALGLGVASAQSDAGYLADVRNLELTVNRSIVENRTDVSLALVPPEAAGAAGVTLVFTARFEGDAIDVDRLSEIVVRAHYRLQSDDRPRSARGLDDTQAMRLNLDARDPNGITLFFFPVSWGYGGFSAPGEEIPVAYFTVTPADVRALAVAKTVAGQVLRTDFVFTPEQLDAVRGFARRVLPAVGHL
jgi:hypothetical protein